MQTEESKTELLVNGNFATRDLTGWAVKDPSAFLVMKDEEGRYNCIVRSQSGDEPDSLSQQPPISPGTHQLAVWYRSSDTNGQPTDATTFFVITTFIKVEDELIPHVELCRARRGWDKFTREFVLPRNADTFQLIIQNLDDAVYKKVFPQLSVKSEQVDVAVRDVSLWKMK